MKFDKETLILFAVCILMMMAWDPFCRYMGWIPAKPAPAQTAPAAAKPAAPAETKSVSTPAPAAPAVTVEAPPAKRTALPEFKLANDDMELTVDPNTGAVTAVALKHYLDTKREKPITIRQDATTLYSPAPLQPGAMSVFSPAADWKTIGVELKETTAKTATLVRTIDAGTAGRFLLEQQWTLGGNYTTEYTVHFYNSSNAPVILPRLVVSAGEIQRWSKLSGDKVYLDPVQIDYCNTGGTVESLAADSKDKNFFAPEVSPIRWTSLSNKYFIGMLYADEPFQLYRSRAAVNAVHVKDKDDEKLLINTGAEYRNFQIPAKGMSTLKLKYYAGPKITDNLDAFAPRAGRTMHLSWGPLDYLARFLLWALLKLHGWCASFGLSIIMLTVLVRLLFYPATAKANASMKKMSAVQPKIKELREKYKDDPQMLQSKTMELYRTEKINPLGGCLPMLLQIPVFFALYGTLGGAVELRHQSFLWCADLAAADTIGTIFGLPINPLVLAWSLLMLLQQKITPSTMEPMQQKMMMIMPIFMLFFTYNLPSGLTLYWTVSQIFSILQMLVQQKMNPSMTPPAVATQTNSKK